MVEEASDSSGLVTKAFQDRVKRAGRWFAALPALWLLAAPLAVFARQPITLLLVGIQAVLTWLLTCAGDALEGSATRQSLLLPVLRMLPRVLSVAALPIVWLSPLGYRVLLFAEVGALAWYLSHWGPFLEPRFRVRPLKWAAVMCALGVLSSGGRLAWSYATNALELEPADGWLGAIWFALPGLMGTVLAWFEMASLFGVEEQRSWGEAGPARWAPTLFELPLVIALSLGAAIGGFVVSYTHGGEPGPTSAWTGFVLCALTFCYLWLHRLIVRSRFGVLRNCAICLLVQAPMVWSITFPTQFDSGRWKRFARMEQAFDGAMARDLAYSGVAIGKTVPEVEGLLGHPDLPIEDPKTGTTAEYEYHFKGGDPCRSISVMFSHGRSYETKFFLCDD